MVDVDAWSVADGNADGYARWGPEHRMPAWGRAFVKRVDAQPSLTPVLAAQALAILEEVSNGQ